ncbi:MAG: general secretion pathway protein GspB [Gammaproteobacteria bacterium]|nr:general secretion pathway protein GspB [Gammaproteobacteria bacterium]MDH3374746.1 general secretion pathway protein GspB [Gammaproteobacteria bacterium]MDH3409388.1 general secretion pathway protein GspB [Gammaproteobacteria bacterium]MDH3553607.1 general secretion pathway protein GspB [Gammaproteobacteria bacterium]
MSFILDALKKSETERQQQAGGEFSSVPSGSGEPQSFKWLWILALLLFVNAAILVGVLMRPDRPPGTPPAVAEVPVEKPQTAQPSFEEKIAAAKQNQPPPIEEAANDPLPRTQRAAARQASPSSTNRVPTIDELRLDGTLQVADLHLDIHVYSDEPAERFVFINMVKHRERSRLEEGPVVTEITPDGVILEHQGKTFLLPRE